jgi:hypothetical protein
MNYTFHIISSIRLMEKVVEHIGMQSLNTLQLIPAEHGNHAPTDMEQDRMVVVSLLRLEMMPVLAYISRGLVVL